MPLLRARPTARVAKPAGSPAAQPGSRAQQPGSKAKPAGSPAARAGALLALAALTATAAATGAVTASLVAGVPAFGEAAHLETTSAPDVPAPDAAAAAVIAAAKTHIGNAYVYGGTGPTSWDCSGLTMVMWQTAGKVASIPRTAAEQQSWTERVPSWDALPGDLVFFGTPAYHVGLYIGDGWMIDAGDPSSGVVERPLYTTSGVTYGRVWRPTMPPVPPPYSGLGAAAPTAPATDVFTIPGGDGATIDTVYQAGKVVSTTNLSGVAVGDPASASMGGGNVAVAVRGPNNQIYYRVRSSGAWTMRWTYLGGVTYSSPALVSPAPGELDVFARGTDDALWYRTYASGAWSSWRSLGGILGFTPSVVSTPSGLVVYAVGTDDHVAIARLSSSGWTGFSSLGGTTNRPPTATVESNGTTRAYVVGLNSVLYVDTGSGWQALSGYLMGDPAAVSVGSGADAVFGYSNSTHQLMEGAYSGTWSGWSTP